MKLLVVEDDAKIATSLKRGLEAEGFAVEMASNGDDGLWLATEGAYDLVVLDIMLPGRNGFEICRKLRERGDWTPILMLTAKDGELDEAEALDLGADDYLTKPFSLLVLVARLRVLLRRAAGRAWSRHGWGTCGSTPRAGGRGGATTTSRSRLASSRSSSSWCAAPGTSSPSRTS